MEQKILVLKLVVIHPDAFAEVADVISEQYLRQNGSQI